MTKMRFLWAVLLIGALCSFAAADWLTITKKEQGFKIAFPSQPEETQSDVPTPLGKVTMHVLMDTKLPEDDENMMYGIIYGDYPDSLVNSKKGKEMVNTFLTNAISGAAKNIQGTIMSVADVSIKGYPGKLAKISFQGGLGIMNIKAYLVKNRAYIMETGCDAGRDNNASTTKFFSSFDLLGK